MEGNVRSFGSHVNNDTFYRSLQREIDERKNTAAETRWKGADMKNRM